MQKENSNGSVNADDDRNEEKPPGFTTVQGKAKTKKKMADIPTPTYYGNTLDKLDEISLSGPRPDGKDIQRKSSKTEHKTKQSRKKVPFQPEKLIMDTPTSPHAIAAAIVEAALVKSQQKKKTKNKGENSSGPTSPSGLSASSRSSSYSSIVGELSKLGERTRSTTPSGILHGM